jgi:hypothetical protein
MSLAGKVCDDERGYLVLVCLIVELLDGIGDTDSHDLSDITLTIFVSVRSSVFSVGSPIVVPFIEESPLSLPNRWPER